MAINNKSLGTTPFPVRLDSSLAQRVLPLAEKTEQGSSAVIRACIRLALPMLEAQPDLVRQLDAGVKDDEVLNSLLARAKIIAEKHNISVLVVLRAGLRYGLKFFEDLDADPETGLNALMLQWVDLGGNERADLERAFGKPAKIPTTQAHELATTINQGIAALALNIEKNPRHAANEPAPKSPKKKPRK